MAYTPFINPMPVTGTFWQALQPVSLTSTTITGSVAVTGAFYQATQPVSIAGTVAVSGPLTDTQLRATPVPVSGSFYQATQPVSGTFWQATQPVSGTFWQTTQPVSIAALPALTAGAAVIGAVTQSGTWNIGTVTTLPPLVAGSAIIGALVANQSVNNAQINGSTISTNTGVRDAGTQRVTIATDDSVPTTAVDTTASGTITTQNLVPTGTATAGSAVEISTIGKSGVLVQTVGTWTGTMQAQGTIDGTNWVVLTGSFLVPGGGIPTPTIPSASQNLYGINCAGMTKIRIAASAAITGSVVINLRATLLPPIIAVGSSLLGAGTSVIGDIGVSYRTTTTGAATVAKVLTAATTNATNLKAAAGRLIGWSLQNTTASVKAVHIHNLAVAPTVGTSVPLFTIIIPANGSKEFNLPGGMAMSTGIAYSITTGITDLDNVATAVGDVIGSIFYA